MLGRNHRAMQNNEFRRVHGPPTPVVGASERDGEGGAFAHLARLGVPFPSLPTSRWGPVRCQSGGLWGSPSARATPCDPLRTAGRRRHRPSSTQSKVPNASLCTVRLPGDRRKDKVGLESTGFGKGSSVPRVCFQVPCDASGPERISALPKKMHTKHPCINQTQNWTP